jgi:hypothetical protein
MRNKGRRRISILRQLNFIVEKDIGVIIRLLQSKRAQAAHTALEELHGRLRNMRTDLEREGIE